MLFTRIIRLRKGSPLLHFAPSVDIDEREIRSPRLCRKSLVVRLFSYGIVLGYWREHDIGESDALREFMRCGLRAEPSAWGDLASQYEKLAAADGGNLIDRDR